MSLFSQVIYGTLCLGICLVIHVIVLAASVPILKQQGLLAAARNAIFQMTLLTTIMLIAIVVAHALQIWLWAIIWILTDAVADLNTAIYFSTVTYTTLGYGDVILSPEWRIFATFSAVAGLLTFGISTAFLVGLIGRLFQD
ncbi:ion channel [Thalassobacter stenotrophicus]|uniref:Voltage-gated potassium channel n=2 Tax=Thalassobacter stenotrophicus TaxID=266809 RepID=A0A0P1EY14_9RHOB|nr:ion channel [Thalassobacter stenotrophicus]PVZ47283.1 Ion transport 2 [Thalassobacter stenotrophicus]CUH60013.1 voltage-gated potassium channel [Thalassobacter stenotrophicus]SHJ40714.1 Ion channel [Thalassobacter stenotrophicus DSM 16310]